MCQTQRGQSAPPSDLQNSQCRLARQPAEKTVTHRVCFAVYDCSRRLWSLQSAAVAAGSTCISKIMQKQAEAASSACSSVLAVTLAVKAEASSCQQACLAPQAPATCICICASVRAFLAVTCSIAAHEFVAGHMQRHASPAGGKYVQSSNGATGDEWSYYACCLERVAIDATADGRKSYGVSTNAICHC